MSPLCSIKSCGFVRIRKKHSAHNKKEPSLMPTFWMRSVIAVGALLALSGTSALLAQEPGGSRERTSGSGSTWYVTLDGSGHFTSIQEAIDQAQNGDTVFIKAGRYVEDVTVHSKEGLKIIGEGPEKSHSRGPETGRYVAYWKMALWGKRRGNSRADRSTARRIGRRYF